MKRKILSVLVVFAMVLTMLPTTVFATIETAISNDATWNQSDKPSEDTTITTDSSAINISISGASETPLDFSEHKLTITDANNRTVTIKASDGTAQLNIANIEINSGTLVLDSSITLKTSSPKIALKAAGAKLKVGDKEFTAKTTDDEITLAAETNEPTVSKGTVVLTGNLGTVKIASGKKIDIGGKEYTANGDEATVSYDGSVLTLSTGKLSVPESSSVTVDGKAITVTSGSDVTIDATNGVTTGSSTATIDFAGKTVSTDAAATFKAADDADIEVTAGTVTISTGTKVKIGTTTYTAAAGDTKITFGSDNVGTLAAGSVTVPSGKGIKVGSATYTATGDAATIAYSAADTGELTAGTVSVAQSAKIKVGTNTYTADGAAATVAFGAEAGTVSSGKVSITAGKVSLSGSGAVVIGTATYTASGDTATVEYSSTNLGKLTDGTVKVSNGQAVKVGNTDITATGENITVSAEGEVAGMTGTDNVKVAGDDAITIDGVTYQSSSGSDGYTVTYDDGTNYKLTPEDEIDTTVTFGADASEKTVEIVDNNGVKNDGGESIESKKLSGSEGATVTVKKSTSDGTIVTGDENNKIGADGKIEHTEEPAATKPGSTGSTTKSYKVNTPAAENGRVYANPIQAVSGTKITLTVYPSSGYELYKLTVVTAKGGKEIATSGSGNTYTFTLPDSDVTVKALFAKPGEIPEEPDEPDVPETPAFVDVADSDYFADAVKWAVENGITDGIGNNLFAPQSSCTRAQIVTFLWRAAGSPEPVNNSNPFADVNAGDYYGKAVLWAVEQGITNGTSATEFSPNATCTRAQAVTFLHRYEKQPAASGSSFADVADGAYYESAVDWAVANDITNGTGNNLFAPDATCTRAQIVTFLYRDMVK